MKSCILKAPFKGTSAQSCIECFFISNPYNNKLLHDQQPRSYVC